MVHLGGLEETIGAFDGLVLHQALGERRCGSSSPPAQRPDPYESVPFCLTKEESKVLGPLLSTGVARAVIRFLKSCATRWAV